MPRYFLEIQYDGTPYRGWQRQPEAPSVQAELERALRKLLHQHELPVVGCGRTDTGVHATRFFAHFDSDREGLTEPFTHGLNAILPPSVSIRRIIPVAPKAHARFGATERGYVYRIHRAKDPFLHERSHLLHPALDVEAMNLACKALIGRQNFSSFERVGSDNSTSICDVRLAEWSHTPVGYVFHIRADRFLRNMVRAVVGTCFLIGRGHKPAEHMAEVIAAQDRGQAGRSAPARGLYLDTVVYPFIPDTLPA